jgi:hypothetical protein
MYDWKPNGNKKFKASSFIEENNIKVDFKHKQRRRVLQDTEKNMGSYLSRERIFVFNERCQFITWTSNILSEARFCN